MRMGRSVPTSRADLWICVTDPHRVGHKSSFHPGDLNFRLADVIVINKANTAPEGSLRQLQESAGALRRAAPCALLLCVLGAAWMASISTCMGLRLGVVWCGVVECGGVVRATHAVLLLC